MPKKDNNSVQEDSYWQTIVQKHYFTIKKANPQRRDQLLFQHESSKRTSFFIPFRNHNEGACSLASVKKLLKHITSGIS